MSMIIKTAGNNYAYPVLSNMKQAVVTSRASECRRCFQTYEAMMSNILISEDGQLTLRDTDPVQEFPLIIGHFIWESIEVIKYVCTIHVPVLPFGSKFM